MACTYCATLHLVAQLCIEFHASCIFECAVIAEHDFCVLSKMQALRQEGYKDPKILLHAILEKARRKGFKFRNELDNPGFFAVTSFNDKTGRIVLGFKNQKQLQLIYDSVYLLFFDTTFARTVFGQKWEQNLVELAECENKISYLSNHLEIDNTNE